MMNREDFAKRLERIQIQEGTSPKALYDSLLPIYDALTQMMPKSLFRYRSCNEKQIDAFQKNLEEGNDFTKNVKDSFPQGMVEKIKEQILATDFEDKKDALAANKRQIVQTIDFLYPLLADASKRPSIIYKPTAIYYGVHITNENKERLHSIAKAKGIAEFGI